MEVGSSAAAGDGAGGDVVVAVCEGGDGEVDVVVGCDAA